MENIPDTVNANTDIPPKNNGELKKKPSFFKSALVVLRGKQNDKKPKPLEVEVLSNNDNWKTIVGSIRPLHIPDNTSPRPLPKKKQLRAVRSVENFDDIFLPPPSPTYSTSSSAGTMSQYASANDLQELDRLYGGGHDYEVNDAFFDQHSADQMIDSKAEEFISQFYEQMRRQHNPNPNPTTAEGKSHE
ncbi:hypothetical protein LguiA_011332 [Lonicera macranthoides]